MSLCLIHHFRWVQFPQIVPCIDFWRGQLESDIEEQCVQKIHGDIVFDE